jgi:hypothetical protein
MLSATGGKSSETMSLWLRKDRSESKILALQKVTATAKIAGKNKSNIHR